MGSQHEKVKSSWDMPSQDSSSQFGLSQLMSGQIQSSWNRSIHVMKGQVKMGLVKSEIFWTWTQHFFGTNVARTNVARTNGTLTVGFLGTYLTFGQNWVCNS